MSGWIPTYSIKAGIADTQTSGLYSTLFWMSNAIFRLIWAFCIKASVNKKLRFIFSTITVFSILLIVFQYLNFFSFVCSMGCLYFGAMLAGVYGFCLAFPIDNGFDNTSRNNANIVMAYCIGQGIMPMPLGYVMRFFGYQSLILMMVFICAVSWWCFEQSIKSIDLDRRVNTEVLEALMIDQKVVKNDDRDSTNSVSPNINSKKLSFF